MITPRQTTLFPTPDLATFHHTLAGCLASASPWELRDTIVLVPSRAAAVQLQWTLESIQLDRQSAVCQPRLLTRDEFYGELHRRLDPRPSLLSPIERLVWIRAAAEAAVAAGANPPFKLRPGLVSEFIAFYDELRRHDRTVEAFERLLVGELDASAEHDRGARRMLRQTRFLALMYRYYETRLNDSGSVDEHRLRERVLNAGLYRPIRHVVVTTGDRATGTEGLWPADITLLARLSGLEKVDVVSTVAVLDAGWRARIETLWPGIEVCPCESVARETTRLVVPIDGDGRRHFVWRDREEELLAVAREVKARDPAERTVVVFQRPLPYLYLARQVFTSANLPFDTHDTLPLAAEPFAAALDLVLAFASSGHARVPTLELLRSPHFDFRSDDKPLAARAISLFDQALVDARYAGDAATLASLAERWRSGGGRGRTAVAIATVVGRLADELAPLTETASASTLLDCLLTFLERYRQNPEPDDDPESRSARARAAVVGLVRELRDAHRQHDDPEADLSWVTSTLRRLIEGATFAAQSGGAGVSLLDARAARYGQFDTVILAGLVDGEWPERSRQSALYPASLTGQLGWAREIDRLRAGRAAFNDLLSLARSRVLVSTVAFEDDAVVTASVLLEDLQESGLDLQAEPTPSGRVTLEAGLAETPERVPLAGEMARWFDLRLARGIEVGPARRGAMGPQAARQYSVSGVERYLSCPFKYFASSVLRLGEEPHDELIMTPRTRGRFVHEVLRAFFEAWAAAGQCAIDGDSLEAARELVREVAERHLAELPPRDRAVERAWLLGSPAAAGVVDRLLLFEVERPGRVRERLLEHPFDDRFTFSGPEGDQVVQLRGIADRIDLLDGGQLRIVDYKTGRAPNRKVSVQLPVYGRCAEQQLHERDGKDWVAVDAGYVAFGEPHGWVPLDRRATVDQAMADGQERFLTAVAGIESGVFPARPVEPFRCQYCEYPTVCRKDYVGDE